MTANPEAAERALHCLLEGCSIRSTERLITPAMEAGLTDHIWSISELLFQQHAI
jgi:hypothetical protein